MSAPFGRIFENLLFSVLIAAVGGWMLVSAAADATSPSASPDSCAVARAPQGIGHS